MVRFNGIWRDHTGVLQQQKHHVLATKVKDQRRGSGSSRASCATAHQIYSKFLQLSRRLACFLDRRENKYELMRYQSTVGNCSSLLPVSNSRNSFQILPHCCHLSGQLGSIVSGRCRGILANGERLDPGDKCRLYLCHRKRTLLMCKPRGFPYYGDVVTSVIFFSNPFDTTPFRWKGKWKYVFIIICKLGYWIVERPLISDAIWEGV